MDCPKCVGKLQPLKIDVHGVKNLNIQRDGSRSTKRWGTETDEMLDGSAFFKSLNLDKCFACDGVWLDKDELKKLQKMGVNNETIASHGTAKLYKQLNEKSGVCPRCKVPMRKMKGKKGIRRVTVDLCGKCKGLWLDGGEVNFAIKGAPKQRFQNIWKYLWSERFIPE